MIFSDFLLEEQSPKAIILIYLDLLRKEIHQKSIQNLTVYHFYQSPADSAEIRRKIYKDILQGSFLADDRPWSALILIKGFIFFEALLRASS